MRCLARFAYAPAALARARVGGARALSAATTWLTEATLNPDVQQAQYAVRGELVLRAMAHAEALKRGEPRPFNKLTFCNIGNPQELGQKPLTFFRQVLALVNCPDLLEPANAAHTSALFAPDAIERAKAYLRAIPGGLGSYTHSQGLEIVRREIAEFITERDGGIKANPSDIFLTDGASPAVQGMLRALIRGRSDGVMVPIPQYPLYSASIALYGGTMVNYYLNEPKGWSLESRELERSLGEAKRAGVNVRALVVINPGNPTGNTLSDDNMREVIEFAARHGLILLADEVYQENVWAAGKTFHSFRKVAAAMGAVDPTAPTRLPGDGKGVQLVSMHSTSKGFTGECGRRGGFFELLGFDESVRAQLYKLASISLCANSTGQVLMGLQCRPPKAGEPSHAKYAAERDGILASLKRRAVRFTEACNKMEGVTCEPAEGALYAFPRIRLPRKAVEAADAAGKAADTFYCLQLLDATGVVLVPGSGFGQRDGEWHFRSTILPPEEDFDRFLTKLAAFHADFMTRYRG